MLLKVKIETRLVQRGFLDGSFDIEFFGLTEEGARR